MNGLLYNPMFNASMGLLAAGGPSKFPVGIGQALNQGLLAGRQADVTGRKLGAMEQEQALAQQQMQMELEAQRQEQAQRQQQQAAAQRLVGQLPPEAQPVAMGLLSAGVTMEDVGKSFGLLPAQSSMPNSYEEFLLGQENPEFRSFLDSRAAAQGTNVDLTLPGSPYSPQTPQGKAAADILELRKRLQGMQPDTPEYQAALGAIEAIENAQREKPTQDDTRRSLFADRMQNAERDLSQLGIDSPGYDPANPRDRIAESLPVFGNYLSTEQGQIASRAKREWTAAMLRYESGAQIGADEFRLADETYFPQAGDSPDVIKQKEDARARVLSALKDGGKPPVEMRGMQLEATLRRAGIADEAQIAEAVGQQLAIEGY